MTVFEFSKSVQWYPHVGDPTFLAWLTVLVYVLAAVACAICAWRAERIFGDDHVWQHRLIWGAMAVGLLFLGFNKQLDLQSWFTATIKSYAWEYGLYDLGRRAQVYFIAGMALVSLVIFVVIAWTFRHVWRHYWLLLLGLVFIARFIITRAAGFYGISLPRLSQFTGGFQITWMLEIAGALVIGLAAYSNIRRGKKGKKVMNEAMWWLTVAGYWVTAVLCTIAALKQKTHKGERNIWWGLAASIFILGINKQQNLTGILTNLGRQNAFQGNWYSSRSGLQLLLVGVFLLVGLVLFVRLVRHRHAVSKLQWIAIVGVIFLFSFALIRAVSLHTIDAFLYTYIAGLQPNWIVELGGITLVAGPAIVTLVR